VISFVVTTFNFIFVTVTTNTTKTKTIIMGRIIGKKLRHGQYIRSTDRRLISIEDTFLWLSRGDLTRETKCEIIAAQAQALQIKYAEPDTDSQCRLCQKFYETIAHHISMPNIGNRTIHKEM